MSTTFVDLFLQSTVGNMFLRPSSNLFWSFIYCVKAQPICLSNIEIWKEYVNNEKIKLLYRDNQMV